MAFSIRIAFMAAAGLAATFANPAAATSLFSAPATIDLGPVAINQSKTTSIPLTLDTGYYLFSASGVSGLNPPFGFNFGTCIGGGATTCDITESFSPTTLGSASGALVLEECLTGGGACVTKDVTLTAEGISLFAGSASYDFGSVPVGTSVTASIPLTLDAGYYLFSASGVSGLNPPFGFGFGTCIGGGGPACDITESFLPTALGPIGGALVLAECPTGGGHTCLTQNLALTGEGVDPTADVPEPASLALFGTSVWMAWRTRRRTQG